MLIVEDGTGLANAESYVSVAYADDYVSKYATPTEAAAWTALDNAGKERALRQGTDFLETRYRTLWVSRRTSQLQRLSWPRSFVDDADCFPVGSDEVPEQVKRADVIAALQSLRGDMIPNITTGSIKSQRSKIGPLEKEVVYASPASPIAWYRRLELNLKEFLSFGRIERG